MDEFVYTFVWVNQGEWRGQSSEAAALEKARSEAMPKYLIQYVWADWLAFFICICLIPVHLGVLNELDNKIERLKKLRAHAETFGLDKGR